MFFKDTCVPHKKKFMCNFNSVNMYSIKTTIFHEENRLYPVKPVVYYYFEDFPV